MYVFLLQRIVNQEKGKSWGTTKGYVKEATEEYIFFKKKMCVYFSNIQLHFRKTYTQFD